MSEDQKNRIREALRLLVWELNNYGGPVKFDIRTTNNMMGDGDIPGLRWFSYDADVVFLEKETL